MARRDDIKKAAVTLFAEKGFDCTPTSEVAKLAGVSEGTVFYHFHTKDGILLCLYEESFEEYLSGLEEAAAGSASGLEAVESCIDHHFAAMRKDHTRALLLVRDFPPNLIGPSSPVRERIADYFNRLRSVLEGFIRRGQADGSVRPCDPRENALLILGLVKGVTHWQILMDGSVDGLPDQARAFCHRALAAGDTPSETAEPSSAAGRNNQRG